MDIIQNPPRDEYSGPQDVMKAYGEIKEISRCDRDRSRRVGLVSMCGARPY